MKQGYVCVDLAVLAFAFQGLGLKECTTTAWQNLFSSSENGIQGLMYAGQELWSLALDCPHEI